MDVRAPALAALAALVLLLLAAGPASAQDLTTPASLTEPPSGFRLTGRQAVQIAERTPEVRAAKRRHPGLDPSTHTRGPGRWQISWFAGDEEVVQVHVSDSLRLVLETWTGPQVAWRMARGYEGAFGRTFNAPYVWIPLGLLFLAPFIDPRRPFRLLHLDLLVLVAFAVSHVYFNRGEIFTSVPLVYPALVYLLLRMLWTGFRPVSPADRHEGARPLVPLVPITWLALALIFLVGFRVALNITDSNVIDVGYAGVVGADQIADGEGLYEGTFPENNRHGDTYGPVNYLTYVPFEQAIPWSGAWDDLPAAHGAAILFDLLALGGLFLLGRRLRAGPDGRRLGIVLAYAWAAYPYSLFVLSTNANDSLVAALVVFALVALTLPRGRSFASGGVLALSAASKFGAAAVAPLLAGGTGERRLRAALPFALAFAAVLAAAVLPLVPDGGLRELYDRTVGYQAGRDSPFSVWGQEDGLDWLQTALQAVVVLLAFALFFVPRRRDPRQLAALAAALLIGVQLTLTHWFYLYVVWFAPLVLVALFAAHRAIAKSPAAEPAEARDTPAPVPAVA